MREVSGPVIGIALVLSAVFIPTAFLPGITGRLYQQFALTIAISVIFSAFNALSLSPALSALLLRPRKKTRGPLGWFFDGFNRVFGSATNGYVNLSRLAIRKAVLSFALLAVLRGRRRIVRIASCRAASCRKKTRATFIWRCNYPMPRRSNAPIKRRARSKTFSARHRACKYTTSVVGFSLLSLVQNTYSAFFFVTFKPWSERTKPEEQYDGHQGEH